MVRPMSDNKKVRFGILGCGMAARLHAGAISAIDDGVLCAVCDADGKRAADFAKEYGEKVQVFDDFDAMLAADIDAVCICTPSGYHADQAIRALQSGKHVAIEKPMALCTQDADRIISACKNSGRLCTVILQNRFSDDVDRVKNLIDGGAFGKLVFCDLYMKYWRDDEYYRQKSWRGTLSLDGGGALMNQGIHGVDLLHYLVGDSTVLTARCKTVLHDIEAEDMAIAMLEFENGAEGVIEASTCAYPGFERRLEIIGTKGSVIFKENRIERLMIEGKGAEKFDVGVKSGASTPDAIGFEKHAVQLGNFAAAILGKETLAVSANDGRLALRVIEDIYIKAK